MRVIITKSALSLDWEHHSIFQQDSDWKGMSKLFQQFLVDTKTQVLEWPSQSPDLHPFENLLQLLKVHVHAWKPCMNSMNSGLNHYKTPICKHPPIIFFTFYKLRMEGFFFWLKQPLPALPRNGIEVNLIKTVILDVLWHLNGFLVKVQH